MLPCLLVPSWGLPIGQPLALKTTLAGYAWSAQTPSSGPGLPRAAPSAQSFPQNKHAPECNSEGINREQGIASREKGIAKRERININRIYQQICFNMNGIVIIIINGICIRANPKTLLRPLKEHSSNKMTCPFAKKVFVSMFGNICQYVTQYLSMFSIFGKYFGGGGDHFQVLKVSEGTCNEKMFWGWGTTTRSLRCHKGHVPDKMLEGWGPLPSP